MTALATSRSFERSVPFEVTRAAPEEGGDGLTFEGYAAVFNSKTRIDSWEGIFDEQISPGAFRKTIRERTPVMQFDHGRHPLIGSIPIGAIRDLGEDDRGLFVEARLAANWLIQPVRDAIANKSVSGMSFRFEVVKEEWYDRYGVRLTDEREIFRLLYEPGDRGPIQRTLREVKVPELGPVVFPAYADTTAAVRSQALAAAQRIEDDDELCRSIRASLVVGRSVELPSTEEASEVARALLFRGQVAADAEPASDDAAVTEEPAEPERGAAEESTVDTTDISERQSDDATIETSEVEEQDESRSETQESKAQADTEPVADHSENRAQDEPDSVHSTPENPPAFADVRTTPSHLELATAEEQQAARRLAAAQFRTRYLKGAERASRYS